MKVPWQHGHTHGEMNVALTIKNVEVERLATEVAQLTGESKTQAIRVALQERRGRLASGIDPAARTAALREFMEQEVWAHVPADLRGEPHDSARDDEIVGYGPDDVPARLVLNDRGAAAVEQSLAQPPRATPALVSLMETLAPPDTE